jgi:hypothetical protein
MSRAHFTVHASDFGLEAAAVAEAVAACGRILARWIGQVVCGLRGHQMLLRYEATRISLRCAWCGHETPGWQIGRGLSREGR